MFSSLVLHTLQKRIREILWWKKLCSENFCSQPLLFILIARVIVASLQVMARNERGRGVPRSLSLGGSAVSWDFKGAERAERKTGWLCQNGREIVREKYFFGVRNLEFCAKFAINLGLWFTMPKYFAPISRLLSPKFPPRFRTFFSLFFPPAHPDCLTKDCSPSSWIETKPHRESGPGVQQSYNMTSNETKRNVLERKMPQELVLVKWLLARQSKGAEIAGVWSFKAESEGSTWAPRNEHPYTTAFVVIDARLRVVVLTVQTPDFLEVLCWHRGLNDCVKGLLMEPGTGNSSSEPANCIGSPTRDLPESFLHAYWLCLSTSSWRIDVLKSCPLGVVWPNIDPKDCPNHYLQTNVSIYPRTRNHEENANAGWIFRLKFHWTKANL